MSLPLTSPPKSICLLRLSAVGDISHTLPIVRTLQAHWPETRITWVIGKLEHSLVGDIPGIEFIIFDKSRRWHAFTDLRKNLKGRQFDVLLHMQMSIRASLASLLINADTRLGFDRQRAKDLQWVFTNARIKYQPRQHVIDSFFGFSEALGIKERLLRWDIPIPDAAKEYAEQQLSGEQATLVISPCSSMSYRNWTAEGYARVADYAIENHGMRVVLTGGPSEIERQIGDEISHFMHKPALNLIGQTNLKQLLAILAKATAVLSPDAGPAHLATAVGTPVIGLYACTNPDRARPYLSAEYVVNKYPQAVEEKHGKVPANLPWGVRVRDAGTMGLIQINEVKEMLSSLIVMESNQ
ncbi:MAG: glycosyltransferase family 9 protein [Gammaproteobacteria bacterium]|nr:glycosyltransferase family 9 protein [Gammaproteobacteria bacterium]